MALQTHKKGSMRRTGIRVNNYLRTKEEKNEFKVTKIELINQPDSTETCVINEFHEELVEGIPLDDDLLLNKCNFDVKRNISCIVLAVMLHDVDKFFIEDKFILIKEKENYKLFLSSFSTESKHGVEEKIVNYLHQLQNVYYDITQEDLHVDI